LKKEQQGENFAKNIEIDIDIFQTVSFSAVIFFMLFSRRKTTIFSTINFI